MNISCSNKLHQHVHLYSEALECGALQSVLDSPYSILDLPDAYRQEVLHAGWGDTPLQTKVQHKKPEDKKVTRKNIGRRRVSAATFRDIFRTVSPELLLSVPVPLCRSGKMKRLERK